MEEDIFLKPLLKAIKLDWDMGILLHKCLEDIVF